MTVPKTFLGQRGGNSVYLLDKGASDDGEDIRALVDTLPIAPAGAGGECIFPTLYLVLTWSMAVTVRIVPVLDGVEEVEEAVEIALTAQSTRTFDVKEIALSRPWYEIGTALTGTVDLVEGSKAVTGQATLFTSEVQVGDSLRFADERRRVYTVDSITSDTLLHVTDPFVSNSADDVAVYKNPAELVRSAMRGTWFGAKFYTEGPLTAGDLIIDSAEIEYEVVREGKVAENA